MSATLMQKKGRNSGTEEPIPGRDTLARQQQQYTKTEQGALLNLSMEMGRKTAQHFNHTTKEK